MSQPVAPAGAFSLLTHIHGDREMAEVVSGANTVATWVKVEVALARAQARSGLFDATIADEIETQVGNVVLDIPRLWKETRVVGYPILTLLNQLIEGMTEEAAGKLHYGATTQDIMDTALALQLVRAGNLMVSRLDVLGNQLVKRINLDRYQVIAGRTHAQQATPTTLGAKWAVFLAEFTRHRGRLIRAFSDTANISLFGAAGTSAAMGVRSAQVRRYLAEELNLHYVAVPWHVARDSLAALALTLANVSASTVRMAREVVDLSRTEIGELSESRESLRGASSTMPQKANPIVSEAIIGLGVLATSSASAVLRFVEAGHERAAGEWQVEWGVLPEVLLNTSSALLLASEVLDELVVYPDRISQNLQADGGALMSESLMMCLADRIGRNHAHEIVYEAVRRSRTDAGEFVDHVRRILAVEYPGLDFTLNVDDPHSYLGETDEICKTAMDEWIIARDG